MKASELLILPLGLLLLGACDPVVTDRPAGPEALLTMSDLAKIISELPLEQEHLQEVYDAVNSSSGNGYDEEYTMQDLFRDPGSGVGEHAVKGRTVCAPTRSGPVEYSLPLRDMLRSALEGRAATRSMDINLSDNILGDRTVDDFLDLLQDSDIQIYWPYAEEWDWETLPVISFDPEDGSEANVGYELFVEGGVVTRREVVVTEKMAMERPVWVVNRNNDSQYTSIELLRKNDPAWNGGGSIIVTPAAATMKKALYIKDFTMKQQGDCWFAGASEYFVKVGSVDDFRASTEAELLLYDPMITDFMMVVRRKELGIPREMNAVLVPSWTPQLERCAIMIHEDDGGTIEKWNCSAVVKWESRSYGFDISIPFHSRDDIVWRGHLTYDYLEAFSGTPQHLGDVDVTFELVSY